MTHQRNQAGFTILELVIATSIFSIVLLLCTNGLLQITKVYYKGITSIKTQEASRSILEEISRGVQFSGGRIVPTTGGPNYRICVGDNRYSFVLSRKLVETVSDPSDESLNVLVADKNPACDTGAYAAGYREMLSPNMRLAKLTLESTGNNLYKITIRVVSGGKEDLNGTKDNCDGNRGNQFCAVSELSTTVQKRIQ